MRQSYKVLVNTSSLYLKIIANAAVTLISTRIVLQALGVESYGLYNLIAGVISLLSFFNGALMVSSQRFLSFAMGEKDNKKLSEVFKISFIVHLILALIVAISLKLLQPLLFNGFLNIEKDMIGVAHRIFDIMILSAFVTILVIPFNAAINAREEMWFFSFSEIVVILLKLGAAVYLLYASSDLLITYTILMLAAITIGGGIKYLWCILRYSECRIKLNSKIDIKLFKEMFHFAGWNTLGSLAMVARSQGIAVVLNIFFGTVVNAAYAVANQVNALVITFAGTLTTVFTPMIVKAKGQGNNDRMLFIAVFSSKMSFFLSCFFALPVLIFTPLILHLWLTRIPNYTAEFCQTIIISFLITQLFPGITRALYAEGNIRWYQIVISILLVSILPVGFLLFSFGFHPLWIFILLVVAQFFTLIATVYFAKRNVGLNDGEFYIKSVLYPCLLFVLSFVFTLLLKKVLFIKHELLEFVIISFSGLVIFTFFYIKLIFDSQETSLLKSLWTSLVKKIRN